MTTEAPSTGGGGRVFAATLGCSGLTWLVLLVFFVIGIGDGSITSFNLTLWLALLGLGGISIWSGYALRRKGRTGLALAALSITALPGLLAALFLLLLLVMQPRWN